jgi:protoheme IX farnesyltransferase
MARFHDFLRLVKIGIVGSNTLTALAGFALAATRARVPGAGSAAWGRGAILVAGTSLLVGGSCALNNWMDRDIDALMERTRDRPTARGAMDAATALSIGLGLSAAGLAVLLSLGPVPAALGLAGALVYLVAYTLMAKRRGAFSLHIGGIAGSVPPLIGWAVVDPRLGGPAWVLFAVLALWQQAHVRSLALMRAGEYRAAGVPMAGLSPTHGASSNEAPYGARVAVLVWVAATLPLPSLAGMPLAGVVASCALGAAWVITGLVGFRSPAWPRLMFVASLAYLVLTFGGLVVVGA